MRLRRSIGLSASLALLVAALLVGRTPAQSLAAGEPWKFAVMSDTQWIGLDDGQNPGTVSVAIIKQLNREFVGRGVKFVVQVGDLVDQTGTTPASIHNTEGVRAAFAQELYNDGIGFFPVRGNHDSRPQAGAEFKLLYPQSQNGLMNATPASVWGIPNPDAGQPFPPVSGSPFVLGSNFSTPPIAAGGEDWRGLSYAFDFSNARFVLLDQFSPLNTAANSNPYPNAISLQQGWIDTVLSSRDNGTHAFVFGHKGLIDESHVDTLFGSDPSQNAAAQDAFISSLYAHGVRYYLQGHDHIHDRSLVSVTSGVPTDPGVAKVQNILCASDSSKFYTPNLPSNDDTYNVPAFQHARQAQIAQELHTVGYYLFTVDGPRVTVDYYSAALGDAVAPDPSCTAAAGCEWLLKSGAPTLNFVKAETFGYSLNGREFLIAQGESYVPVQDAFEGTEARILGGSNGSTAKDFDGRSFIKTVDTGWTTVNDRELLASNILTLWGVSDLYNRTPDAFALSISYANKSVRPLHLGSGGFGIAARNAQGTWVNAVDLNDGAASRKTFVVGPWKAEYRLGTYGIDPSSHTAWAVIDHAGEFAVARNIEPVPGQRK